MDEYTKKDFAKIIKRNALELRRWMKLSDSNCGRIYDRSLSDLDFTVDLYDTYTKVVDYTDGGMEEETVKEVLDLISRMAYVEKAKIVYQVRKKREGIEQHSTMSEEMVCLQVKENGLNFNVDLTSHIDTGLFLDLAQVRQAVKDSSEGKNVLNLFSYTGAFSVYAASGLAKKVVSVDLSNTATAKAEANLKDNGFLAEEEYPCIAMDALTYIKQAQEKNDKFDMIIFDPPSFSNSNKMDGVFDVQKQYLDYIYEISLLMEKGSVLIFSTNLSTFQFDKKALKASFKIKDLTMDLKMVGFTKKNSLTHVWSLEKVADMKKPLKNESAKKGAKMEKVKDDSLDRLTLSWDDEEKKEAVAPRKDARRDYSDRKRRENNDRRRYYSDRPRRDFEERKRRDYSDRPRRDFDDRPRRDFSDRPRRDFDDRPRRDFSDRPRRDFDDRPRRDFSDRLRRDFDDRPRRDFSDRPRRDFDDRPRRDSFDRPRRDYDERPRREDRDEKKIRAKKSSPKPYGFDNFMETKSRKKDSVFIYDDNND